MEMSITFASAQHRWLQLVDLSFTKPHADLIIDYVFNSLQQGCCQGIVINMHKTMFVHK